MYYLSVIQELFGQCGADKMEDAPWLKLAEIHLPYNGLTELDVSLVRYEYFYTRLNYNF